MAHKPCLATPVDMAYKTYLATTVDISYKPCLAITVDATLVNVAYKPCLVASVAHKPWFATTISNNSSSLSGTITASLRCPSPTYMFWEVTIGLNCEWSPVSCSVMLQSSISWRGRGLVYAYRFSCMVFLHRGCIVFGPSSFESEVSLSSFGASHSPLYPPVAVNCVNRSPVTRWF